MKKLACAITICCTFFLTACNTSKIDMNDSASMFNSDSNKVESIESRKDTDVTLEDTLKMKDSGISRVSSQTGASMGISSSNGYYEVVTIFKDGMNILYTDYETNTQMFLCARPECTHDNETCQSFVDTTAGNLPGLGFKDDNLFIISPGSADGIFKPRIEIANEDGTNRRLVAEFTPSQNIGTGLFCADNTNIFFVMDDYKPNGDYERSLQSVNYETGEKKKILDCEQFMEIYDAELGYLYLHNVKYPDKALEYPKEENYDSMEAYLKAYNEVFQEELKRIEQQIIQVNLEDPTNLKIIAQWMNGTKEGGMRSGIHYYYDYEDRFFVSYNLETQEKKIVRSSLDYDIKDFILTAVIDGVPVFTAIIGHIIEEEHEELIIGTFAVDFQSNEIKENRLQNNWNRPVEICGQYEDKLFVYNEIEKVTYMDEVDGTPTELEAYRQKQALITIEDYLVGKRNYFPTEMVDMNP